MFLGLSIIGVVGLLRIGAGDNAAHDVRQAIAFLVTETDGGFQINRVFRCNCRSYVAAVISVAQFFGTVPLIQKSEVYERKFARSPPSAQEQAGTAHEDP